MVERIRNQKRIASIGWDQRLKLFGGGPFGAITFRRWAETLGHKADLISFTGSGQMPDDSLKYVWGIEYQTHRWKDMPELLNNYDFAFFSIPFPIGYKRDNQDFFVDLYSKLTIPFLITMRGEYDKRYYDLDLVKEILSMEKCIGLGVVYRGFWDYLTEKPKYPLYPSVLPEYSIKDTKEDKQKWVDFSDLKHRKGLLFAHRWASVKRPNILGRLASSQEFLKVVDKRIEVWGAGTFMGDKYAESAVYKWEPKWDRYDRWYNVFDASWHKKLQSFVFFWDVSGGRQRYVLKRLNNSGSEALGNGCIPLVSKEDCPDWLKGHAILVSIDEYNHDEVVESMGRCYDNYEDRLMGLREAALSNDIMGYDAIQKRINTIITEGTS